MSKEKINSQKTVIIITLVLLICKILGFLKNSVLAYFFGTSPVVDAYVMTFSIGTITSGWVAGLIGNFTPKFKQIEAQDGKDKAFLFSSQVFNLIMVLVLFLVVILELSTPLLVKIVAPGFENVTYDYTVHFFRLYCINILFFAVFRFSQEYLNCNQNHLAAVFPDLIMSALCIVVIVFSHYAGADYLILGNIIAVFLQGVIAHISTRKNGFKIRKTELWNQNLKSLIVMAIPIFISDTLANINTLIDKIFASNLESGIVSALDYANTMKEFAYQVGTIAIVTIIFPVISKFWAEKNIDAFKNKVLQGVDYFSVIFIPIIVGIILVGDLAISIVFKRGQFDDAATVITTNAFIIYSLNLLSMVYRCIFLKAFYAMQKTRYILLISSINVILNICLNFMLVSRLGYIGLTLSTTLAALICMPLYFYLFKRSIPNVSYKLFVFKFLKCLVSAIVMALVLFFTRKLLGVMFDSGLIQNIIILFVLVLLGIVIYSGMGCLLRIDEIKHLITTGVNKIIKKRI